MCPFQRHYVSTLLERLAEPPRTLIILCGPRQSGKTTIVRQALETLERGGTVCQYHAADVPGESVPEPGLSATSIREKRMDQDWLVHTWEKARAQANQASRSAHGFVLIFDELQKISQWSSVVKGLWDADRHAGCPMHVVLLGSAPLLMQQGLVESMAGRFELLQITHWSFTEMQEAFDFGLEEYLFYGGYPGAAVYIHDHDRWRSYIQYALLEPNIQRDLFAMARVDKPALFKQLVELGCGYSGQLLSYNKMLGQLKDAGNTTTLAHYLELLHQVWILVGLQKYAHGLYTVKRSSPKLNVLNTALMTAHCAYTLREAQVDRTFWGRLVESAVGAHLYNTGMHDNISLYYWREHHHEVDFVLEQGSRLIAVEVKSGQGSGRYIGLDRFRERFKGCRTLIVAEGGIPLSEFLSVPARHWFDEEFC